MLIRTLALAALLGGCAGSMERVRGALAEAPDWYDQRRVEIRGEGYPDIAEIPTIDETDRPGADLNVDRTAVGAAEMAFLTHPRAEPASVTATDMLAWREDMLAKFGPVSTPPDILTAAEIEALRKVFDKYAVGG